MSRGAVRMLAWRVIDRLIGLISTVILARLLIPADFGLVALAMSIIAVIELAKSFSFETAIIQKQEATREHFDTAWTLNALFGLAGTICLAVLAYPAALLFGEPRLTTVILLLAPTLLFQGLGNIGVVQFQKNLDFGKDFNFLVVRRLITFGVTVALAVALRSYWALIVGTLIGSILGLLISYRVHPFRPRFSLKALPELMGFSKWLMLNNVIFFAANRGSHFVIAKVAGTGPLGIFTIAHEIGSLPASELVAPINRVAFPAYSKVAQDRPRLKAIFLKVMGVVVTVVLPIAVGIAVLSPDIVQVLLGAKWTDCIPLLRMLAIAGALAALQNNLGYLLLSINNSRMLAIISFVHACLLLVFVVTGAYLSAAYGAATGLMAANAVVIGPVFYIVFKLTDIPLSSFLPTLGRPLLGGCVMGMVLAAFGSIPESASGLTGCVLLALKVLLGMLVYSVVVWTAWNMAKKPDGAESFLVDKVSGVFQGVAVRVRSAKQERS